MATDFMQEYANERFLHAANNGIMRGVQARIDSGGNLNLRDKKSKKTALHLAAERGNTEVVRALINADAALNFKDNSGYTPLHWAVYSGHESIVNALLAAGAKTSIKDQAKYQETPLHLASRLVNDTIVEALLKAGASPDELDIHAGTPLHNSIHSRRIQQIRTLLEHGADPNARDDEGNTPLHWAIADTEATQALLDSGADTTITNNDGKTARQLAREQNKDEIANLLDAAALEKPKPRCMGSLAQIGNTGPVR